MVSVLEFAGRVHHVAVLAKFLAEPFDVVGRIDRVPGLVGDGALRPPIREYLVATVLPGSEFAERMSE
jgi:hypothetical protein